MRKRRADGSWICSRCKLQGSKVETELQAATKDRDLAAEKAKEASLLLKEEKKKRLQLLGSRFETIMPVVLRGFWKNLTCLHKTLVNLEHKTRLSEHPRYIMYRYVFLDTIYI
jgi:hypothetical protein